VNAPIEFDQACQSWGLKKCSHRAWKMVQDADIRGKKVISEVPLHASSEFMKWFHCTVADCWACFCSEIDNTRLHHTDDGTIWGCNWASWLPCSFWINTAYIYCYVTTIYQQLYACTSQNRPRCIIRIVWSSRYHPVPSIVEPIHTHVGIYAST
jgi:hypothetical protein